MDSDDYEAHQPVSQWHSQVYTNEASGGSYRNVHQAPHGPLPVLHNRRAAIVQFDNDPPLQGLVQGYQTSLRPALPPNSYQNTEQAPTHHVVRRHPAPLFTPDGFEQFNPGNSMRYNAPVAIHGAADMLSHPRTQSQPGARDMGAPGVRRESSVQNRTNAKRVTKPNRFATLSHRTNNLEVAGFSHSFPAPAHRNLDVQQFDEMLIISTENSKDVAEEGVQESKLSEPHDLGSFRSLTPTCVWPGSGVVSCRFIANGVAYTSNSRQARGLPTLSSPSGSIQMYAARAAAPL
ncbi:hypothetical protein C8Q80DRAFT_1124090 [Daedaleopsis nitida]|nr:hypothetical protein C8Q80DRAFT_1124090 [Daedaleopsis nitida]